jgi:hypothetical protein
MQRSVLVLAAILTPTLTSLCASGARAEGSAWSPVSVAAAREKPAATQNKSGGANPLPDPMPPLPERKTAKDAAPVPQTWSEQEIAEAQARCTQILSKINVVAVHQPPIREGKDGKCGNAAPIRLLSLGRKPRVTFSPPALVNCEMAAALYKWVTGDVQRLAKKHLGERIAKVEVMSDYSCRASAGRHTGRLSEHAYVDALDIRGFVTESGKVTDVIDTWGPTQRDIAAQIAADQAAGAKADAIKEAAIRAAADMAGQKNLKDAKSKPGDTRAPAAVASTLGTPGSGLAKRTRANGVERITVTLPGATQHKPLEIAARLGGPQAAKRYQDPPSRVAILPPQSIAIPTPGPRAQFLRAAHDAACRIFGTTLGPEANEAHRNHFHVDMAERKVKNYEHICD